MPQPSGHEWKWDLISKKMRKLYLYHYKHSYVEKTFYSTCDMSLHGQVITPQPVVPLHRIAVVKRSRSLVNGEVAILAGIGWVYRGWWGRVLARLASAAEVGGGRGGREASREAAVEFDSGCDKDWNTMFDDCTIRQKINLPVCNQVKTLLWRNWKVRK